MNKKGVPSTAPNIVSDIFMTTAIKNSKMEDIQNATEEEIVNWD